jgi:hypothetical protein
MIKSALIAGAALGVLHGAAAHAGVYANVEANQSFQNRDYNSTLVETHLGFESPLGKSSSWYIQGGPAFLSTESETIQAASGKVGLSSALTDKLGAYGELSAVTADDYDFDSLSVGVKAGLKYSF